MTAASVIRGNLPEWTLTTLTTRTRWDCPRSLVPPVSYSCCRLILVSGTTTLFLHAAKFLKFTDDELYLIRLAMLAWMMKTKDHAFHEVMTAAEGFGLKYAAVRQLSCLLAAACLPAWLPACLRARPPDRGRLSSRRAVLFTGHEGPQGSWGCHAVCKALP